MKQYRVMKTQLRNLSQKEFLILRALCRLSKSLYNEALFNVRQAFIRENRYIYSIENWRMFHEKMNYRFLGDGASKQILRYVDRSMKSFFALLKLKKAGKYDSPVKLPKYLDKEGFFPIILIHTEIRIRDGKFKLPISKNFKNEKIDIRFEVPKQLEDKKIKEFRIVPSFDARFFEIQFIYEVEDAKSDLNRDKTLGIDLGLDNLATCVSTDGDSLIIDGRQIKSTNQNWNKRMARIQSIKDRQKIKDYTLRQCKMTRKRNRKIDHAMYIAARMIIDFCLKHRIGRIVIGTNRDWKRKIDLGAKTNQNFVQIPHDKLRRKISDKCQMFGIEYIEQEESYTSKASFFDNDMIPIYSKNDETEYQFSGKRIKRGLYRISDGSLINADINGALNIIRKCKPESVFDIRRCKGSAAMPVRKRLVFN